MNIHELDSYNLGDAVKFNDRLNPRIWGADEKMRPEVREQLLKIADDFREFLGIDVEVKDITVSGSNAAYTYTPHSDIDLHLVVDLPEADANEVYRELFDAKKYAYNEQHDIKIGGYDVELYVQDANKTHHSQGIYSIVNNDWISVPKRQRPDVDDISVKSKFEDLGHRIEAAIRSGDFDKINDLAGKIKDYRQAGLDAHGEFGPENLAFKILRTQGLIKKLYDARNAAKDQLLSLDERKKKRKKKVRYGYGAFGGYWYPGTAYAGQDHPAGTEGGDGGGDGGGESIREDAGMTWDGVNPTTDMFTSEDATMTWDGVNPSTAMFTTETKDKTDEQILQDFIDFCVKELKIKDMPRVKLRRDPQWPQVHKTFGRYNDETKTLEVAWGQRHIMDVLRTVAHELTHKHQHEREGHRMGPDAGETGSPYENEANARAGVLMRDYGRLHPEYFAVGQAHDLSADQLKENKKNKLYWTDLGDMSMESKMEVLEQFYTQGTLTENIKETDKEYFLQLDKYSVKPKKNHSYISALLMLVKDKVVQLEPIDRYTVLGKKGNQYIFQRKDKSTFLFPSEELRDISVYKAFFFDDKNQFNTFNSALTIKFGTELKESASGYIPTRAQAKDPRYSMALTVDIKPGQVGKEANKLKLKTDKQGHPQIARANGLFESLMSEYQQFKEFAPGSGRDPEETLKYWATEYYWTNYGPDAEEMVRNPDWDKEQAKALAYITTKINSMGYQVIDTDDSAVVLKNRATGKIIRYEEDDLLDEDYSPDEPPGPEFKPTMPAGTLRVDVSDVYDWYKLGQHISNMKGLGQHDFGKGPPSTIISFGDEDTEHKFIGDLEATGLNVTDIDPADPKKRPGKKIKTDPTYNVDEDEDLDEVKMSPSALEKFATSPEAKGIRAGFEAELIFRDTQGENDEMDPEPDYDYDERAYSIQQVIDFFSNDEYGFGLSDRGVSRLENDLDETYMNWYDEKVREDFGNEAEDLVREQHLDEVPMGERILAVLTDGMELTDEQAEQIFKLGSDAPKFQTSAEQEAFAEQNPDYRTYMEAVDDADAILDEEVETSIRKQDGYYDQALDDFRDSYSPDSDSFFSDVGLRWMSDIANEYNLDWPVWNMDARSNDGSRDWDEIGASLQDAVDMPVKVSTNYHSAARREGTWIIEPDGSLSPDDKSEEMGLEIVSPPMPLLTAIEKLKQVTDWANDPNGGNAYTNSSTGLHMGVSLPTKGGDVDYVKLILFMGDKYVQQQFGREANTYCASAFDKLKQNIKGQRSDPAGVVELLRHGLTELAYKELQKGVGTSKYTSAHLQNGYIEFRSPGGDWLAKSDEDIGILENTMLRFARAMAIAGDPSAERQEYAKKLYKLVTQDNEQYADQLRLFSEFSAGTISKEQLKKQWADTVLQKEIPGTGKEEYEVYRRDNKDSPDAIVGTFYARDYEAAYDLFLRQYGRDINELDVRLKQPWFDVFDADGKLLLTMRASDIDKATQRVQYEYGEKSQDWNIYRRPDDTPEPKVSPRAQVAKRIVKKPQGPTEYNYEIVDNRTVDLKVVDRFYADREQTANAIFNRWLQIKNLPNDTENYGYRKSAQAADDQRDSVDIQRRLGVQDVDTDVAQNFEPRRQNYELVSDEDPDRVVHRMTNATADEVRAWIAQQEAGGMPPGFLRTRIVAEAIDPVSGAGAVSPRPTVKKIEKKAVSPVEPVIKRQAYHSAIGQAISQKDLENMTQQIQVARRLGDDVNESEVVAFPGNVGPAKKIAAEWVQAFNNADSADRNQILAGLQRQLADLGWQITTTKNYGGVLKHLATKRFIPLQRLTENADDTDELKLRELIAILDKNIARLAQDQDPQMRNLYYKFKTQRRQAEKKLAKLAPPVEENFADGRVKGKSRPGRVKRAGASCKGSVSDLRARARKYGGEKGKMYHWCANMKSGRKK